MSKPSWQVTLTQTLRALTAASGRAPRVAILGVGHELNGDDAAGLVVARALIAAPGTSDRLLILDAGPAPENTTGTLRQFAPELVLLVDAAQMDAPPGAIRWLDWQDVGGVSASTHTLPFTMLARYLVAELGCTVALIGIQPAGNQLDAPLTAPAQAAVDALVRGLRAALAVD